MSRNRIRYSRIAETLFSHNLSDVKVIDVSMHRTDPNLVFLRFAAAKLNFLKEVKFALTI
jgi:hypothetical protein